jgi:hypothetical protein
MSAIIDQMDKPNNREADDRAPRAEDEGSDSVSESVGGSYYYDDATGYEVYEGDDDESAGDDPNRNLDEDELTTEYTEKNEK